MTKPFGSNAMVRRRFLPILAVLAVVSAGCGQYSNVHGRAAALGQVGGNATGGLGAPGSSTAGTPGALPGGGSVPGSVVEGLGPSTAASRAAALAASGPYAGEVGVTKDSVTIGIIYPRSGPYAAATTNVEPAVQAAFNVINEKGGINGRKLVAAFGDDGYNDASVALASAKSLTSHSFGVSTIIYNAFAATHGYLDQHHVPFIFGNAAREPAQKLRYGFAASTYIETEAEMLPQFMIKKFNAKTKRIGVIYQDTPEVVPAINTFKAAAKRAGLNVVITQPVSEVPSTCVNEVSNLQNNAHAEVVWLAAGPIPATCILRDAKTIGYSPTWTGTGSTFNFNVTNTATGCQTDGMITMGSWVTLEAPDGKRYRDAMAKYYPNNASAQTDDIAFIGWGLANYWAKAMLVAGPSPTRDSFVAGMETLRDWDSGHFSPTTFGPGDRTGPRKVLTIQVKNCEWVTIDHTWRDHF